MKKVVWGVTAVALACLSGTQAGAQADLQQKLAAAKTAAAANQQALRLYSWLEKTELSLKGEVKSTSIDMCRYGPDGKVQKTPVVQPPPPEKKRGLKGRIIENKKEEMKEDLQAAVESGTLVVSMAHNMAVPQKFRGVMLEVITEFVNTPGMASKDAASQLADAVEGQL